MANNVPGKCPARGDAAASVQRKTTWLPSVSSAAADAMWTDAEGLKPLKGGKKTKSVRGRPLSDKRREPPKIVRDLSTSNLEGGAGL